MLRAVLRYGCAWVGASLGALGVLCAWTMRRYSTLSARNFYAAAAIGAAGDAAVVAGRAWTLAMVLALPAAFWVCGALYGRRLSLADLGAGEELRSFEQSRRWAWQPRPARKAGERIYLRSQGELVHKRPWPAGVPYAPMSSVEHDGLRLPLGEGQHIFACGATGSGKTTTMRRVLAARTLTQNAALLILDQKGDEEDVQQMSRLAAAAEVPFVLIDPLDPSSDRYQPLWGTPAQVAARGRRADQTVRALLLRHPPIAPRHRLPRAPRRRQVATVNSVPDRRVPSAPLRRTR